MIKESSRAAVEQRVERLASDSMEEQRGAFCCFASSVGDGEDAFCSKCYKDAAALEATPFHGSDYCTAGSVRCSECGGKWCEGAPPEGELQMQLDKDEEQEDQVEQLEADTTMEQAEDLSTLNQPGSTSAVSSVAMAQQAERLLTERVAEQRSAFCCFASAVGDGEDAFCRNCYKDAAAFQATAFHGSDYCSSGSEQCLDCGGIWCEGVLQ